MGFGYEDLKVWREAVDFADTVLAMTEDLDLPRKHYRLIDQLESAATSIAANIAEGKGRNSKKEFVQFLYVARGSLYEAMTFLEIFKRRAWISDEEFCALESHALEIVRMLKGLINGIYRTMEK